VKNLVELVLVKHRLRTKKNTWRLLKFSLNQI